MTDLDLIFCAYLERSRKTKAQLAEYLNISRPTFGRMWKAGVTTWRWEEVLRAAWFLGIPIDILREQLTYRKEKQ
ncbi:MAG: helix-turn-helix domain-containing protein [Firmicutes bacterium]|jgi:hypothetical protein|nr:helix-turn-helix domain-containing protein [Bacillota bacterium]